MIKQRCCQQQWAQAWRRQQSQRAPARPGSRSQTRCGTRLCALVGCRDWFVCCWLRLMVVLVGFCCWFVGVLSYSNSRTAWKPGCCPFNRQAPSNPSPFQPSSPSSPMNTSPSIQRLSTGTSSPRNPETHWVSDPGCGVWCDVVVVCSGVMQWCVLVVSCIDGIEVQSVPGGSGTRPWVCAWVDWMIKACASCFPEPKTTHWTLTNQKPPPPSPAAAPAPALSRPPPPHARTRVHLEHVLLRCEHKASAPDGQSYVWQTLDLAVMGG